MDAVDLDEVYQTVEPQAVRTSLLRLRNLTGTCVPQRHRGWKETCLRSPPYGSGHVPNPMEATGLLAVATSGQATRVAVAARGSTSGDAFLEKPTDSLGSLLPSSLDP